MGVYIGDVWIPYVSNFDVDRGSRRVQIVRHIDKAVPPHFAEFHNPILNANIGGTLIQNSSSPKTATDYAEDVLSLLDSEKAYNYIHEYQERSGWLSVGDVESPNDADTPLSREYNITGNFLPSKTYQPRTISNPAIITNDFSLVLGSSGCDNFIPLPTGATYTGALDTITRITKDGTIMLVEDNSGVGVPFMMTEDEHDAGECKVWDSVTLGNSTESTWIRVYNADHVFTGDIYIENGLVREQIVTTGTSRKLYSYDSTGQVWNQYATEEAFFQSVAGYNYIVDTVRFTELTPDRIELEMSVHASSYPETTAKAKKYITRGQYSIYSFLDSSTARHDINVVFDYGFQSNNFIADKILAQGTAGSTEYGIVFSITQDFIYMINRPDSHIIEIASNGTEIYASDSEEIFESIIPFDTSKLFKECEDMTLGGGTTYYTGVDASPKTGNTGVNLPSQYQFSKYSVISGTDLPSGTYKLFVRAKDTNQVTDDLRLYVYNESESESIANIYFTLTSDFEYYVLDVTLSTGIEGDTLKINCEKATTGSNTITVDYILWVPITSPNGNFPQDISHQSLVNQNLKRELIGRE